MTDKFDQIAIDLIDGKDCAGGCCSASDIADALRQAVAAERKRCKEIADLYVSQARPAGDESVGDCPLTAHFDGQRLVAQNIGHDIENGL